MTYTKLGQNGAKGGQNPMYGINTTWESKFETYNTLGTSEINKVASFIATTHSKLIKWNKTSLNSSPKRKEPLRSG